MPPGAQEECLKEQTVANHETSGELEAAEVQQQQDKITDEPAASVQADGDVEEINKQTNESDIKTIDGSGGQYSDKQSIG